MSEHKRPMTLKEVADAEYERPVDALVRERPFPMQGGPAISWDVAEQIYERYSKLFGAENTLETIAYRGGFGWAEVEYIWKEYSRRMGSAA